MAEEHRTTVPFACDCKSGMYVVLFAFDTIHARQRLKEEYQEEATQIVLVK